MLQSDAPKVLTDNPGAQAQADASHKKSQPDFRWLASFPNDG
jgi:hypothetical protein